MTDHVLAASEVQFRLFVEHAQDMIYRYRVYPSFGTEYVSPASTSMTGYTPEEFYADPELPFKIIHADDRSTAFRMRETPADFLEPVRLRWCRRDGTLVWVEHRNVPVYDDTGQLVAIEGIGRDITQIAAVKQRLETSETQLRELAARLQTLREEEVTNLARELHDELGQTLTSIKLDLARTAEALNNDDPARARELVHAALAAIDSSTDVVRRISTDLRPAVLDHLGLHAAIEFEAARVQRRTGIRCRVSPFGAPLRLTGDRCTAIFRIVQEALTNVVRHSNASAVRIRLQQTPLAFRLEVHDNGHGISAEQLSDPKAIGLLGMRERAQMVGGALEITGRRARGTTVMMTIPLEASESA